MAAGDVFGLDLGFHLGRSSEETHLTEVLHERGVTGNDYWGILVLLHTILTLGDLFI